MNIVVGIACLVAVAVLEGVTGFPDKQLTNDNQIEKMDNLSILQDDEIERQERGTIERIACRIFDGQCQSVNDFCPGEIRTGSLWCRNSRRYGCCIPPPPISYTLDCEIDGMVYPNGYVAKKRCILLKCNNGTWEYNEWNDICGVCYAYGKSDVYVRPYVPHNISGVVTYSYNVAEDGTYVFSQSGLSSPAQTGVDVTIEFLDIFQETCVTDVIYYEPGITIELCFFTGHAELLVTPGNGPGFSYIFEVDSPRAVPFTATLGTVLVIFEFGDWPYYGEIYILGSQGLSVYVYFDQYIYDVVVMAMPSLYDELYGLCDVFPAVAPPYPEYWTMSYDGLTNNTNDFIGSWKIPRPYWPNRQLNKHHQNPSREQTLQDTDRTIIERSSSEILKMCEEMNKGPCTVLPSEECETLKETCVSRMSNAGIPGNRSLNESSG